MHNSAPPTTKVNTQSKGGIESRRSFYGPVFCVETASACTDCWRASEIDYQVLDGRDEALPCPFRHRNEPLAGDGVADFVIVAAPAPGREAVGQVEASEQIVIQVTRGMLSVTGISVMVQGVGDVDGQGG